MVYRYVIACHKLIKDLQTWLLSLIFNIGKVTRRNIHCVAYIFATFLSRCPRRFYRLPGCTKDEILNHYNNVVQSAGSIELTGNSSLQGKKDNGIDDYTGTYQADYKAYTGTEYLFGGTSIKREAGKDIAVTCTLEVTSGTAKVFWISGADEAVTLLETTGTYSDTITLPDGGNYIGIECENFTGNIEMDIE